MTIEWDLHSISENALAEDVADYMVARANLGDQEALKWISKFQKPRLTKKEFSQLLEDLIDVAPDVTLIKHPVRNGMLIEYRYRFPAQKAYGDLYALAMLRIIESDLLPRIRHCNSPDCGKLFFGDRRAKWCSAKCGSRNRVRDKRRRDRQ